MQIRKGLVYFVCKDREQMFNMFGTIRDILKENVYRAYRSFDNCSIEVNGYRLLFKTNYNDSNRGYRPEIVYIDKKSNILVEHIQMIVQPKSFLSVRKEPIRFIDFNNEFNYINLKELIDDNYALENTVDEERLERWNHLIGITTTKEDNSLNFAREYECNWIGDSNEMKEDKQSEKI